MSKEEEVDVIMPHYVPLSRTPHTLSTVTELSVESDLEPIHV